MEFLSDTNELAAMDVLIFVREAMSRYDEFMSVWCLIRDLMFQVRDIAANYNWETAWGILWHQRSKGDLNGKYKGPENCNQITSVDL